MSYVLLDPQPGPRAAEMLVGSNDDRDSPYCQVADGLYPGETAFRLATGHYVAVDSTHRRIETGEGVDLRACARWIDGKGRTRLDPHDQHVEGNVSHSARAIEVKRFGLDALKREMALAVLGEPPTMVPIEVNPDAPVVEVAVDEADRKANPGKAPPGTALEPGKSEAPMIDWSEDVRLNASILHAIELSGAVPESDVAQLLEI